MKSSTRLILLLISFCSFSVSLPSICFAYYPGQLMASGHPLFADENEDKDKDKDKDKKDKKDKSALAQECKELAIKIDWLGRYQDRAACTQALDGTIAYFAAYHIDSKEIRQAKTLLEEAIVKLNFAIDINCYGQDDMKVVAQSLQNILDQL